MFIYSCKLDAHWKLGFQRLNRNRYILLVLLLPLSVLVTMTPVLVNANNGSTLSLQLSPESTVPAANSPNASGTGSVTVNTVTGEITGTVVVNGLTGQLTGAYVHQGGVGEVGPVVVGMNSNDDGSVWTIAEGSTLDAVGIQNFIDGNLYINVHTEANAPGELRLQLVDSNSSTASLQVDADAESTVPPANAPSASTKRSVKINAVVWCYQWQRYC